MVGAAGAIVLAATGDLAGARAAMCADDAGPPTHAAHASRNLAEELLLSMDNPHPVAVTKLGQAIATEQAASHAMPESPAALVALAALHGGDPVRARCVVGRPARSDLALRTISEGIH